MEGGGRFCTGIILRCLKKSAERYRGVWDPRSLAAHRAHEAHCGALEAELGIPARPVHGVTGSTRRPSSTDEGRRRRSRPRHAQSRSMPPRRRWRLWTVLANTISAFSSMRLRCARFTTITTATIDALAAHARAYWDGARLAREHGGRLVMSFHGHPTGKQQPRRRLRGAVPAHRVASRRGSALRRARASVLPVRLQLASSDMIDSAQLGSGPSLGARRSTSCVRASLPNVLETIEEIDDELRREYIWPPS